MLVLNCFGKRNREAKVESGEVKPQVKRQTSDDEIQPAVSPVVAAATTGGTTAAGVVELDEDGVVVVDSSAELKAGFQEDGRYVGEDGREQSFVMSAKIKKFMEIVEAMVKNGDEKAIAFSQWTRMLDLLEISLKQRGIRFARLDGYVWF